MSGHDPLGTDPLTTAIADTVFRVVMRVGDATVRTGKSQIAFRRRRVFAAIWRPGRYLRGRTAPLVLTVYLPLHDPSPRWKEVVQPTPGRYTHHLELWNVAQVDGEVEAWLRAAWEGAA